MSEGNMSPADIMALMNSNNNGSNNMWNNPFMYLIWLSIFGNGGYFGGNGNAATVTAGAVDRASLAEGLNNQTVLNELRAIENSVKDNAYVVQNTGNDLSRQMCSSFGNTNLSMSNGFNNTNAAIMGSSNGIINAINTAASNQQVANCNLAHAIQDNKYEMAQNTCAITNAVHNEGEMTRKVLVEQQMQDLRDAKDAVQRDLQSAQLTLANATQTQNILDKLGRYVTGNNCCNNF